MASIQAVEQVLAHHAITFHDFDPDSADPADVAWVDLQNFRCFTVAFIRTVGTGAVDSFRILANAQSNGGGTDVVVKTVSPVPQADAFLNYHFVECTAEEVQAAAEAAGIDNVRYVSASIEFATNTDEGIVMYMRSHPRFAHSGLTANSV